MRSRLFLALLLGCGLCFDRREASEPWWKCLQRPPCCPTCPDIYTPKPLPCTKPARYCGPNDYCGKPLPTVCPVRCWLPDDFCAKPLPCVPRCYPPWYTCA